MIKTYRFLCSLKFILSILEWSCFPKIVMVHKTKGGGLLSPRSFNTEKHHRPSKESFNWAPKFKIEP